MPPPPDIAPHSGRFIDNAHYFALRTYFEDTDFSGIVYHARYLHFMERARSDMLRCLGIGQREAFEEGGGAYAVADLHIKYIRPAKFDDDLLVVSKVTDLRAAAVTIAQQILRGEEEIARAEVLAAFLSASGRPVRQPKLWTSAFASVMARKDS